MSTDTQILSDTAMTAWRSFLRAHVSVAKSLDHELAQAHGLTLSDYDVLLQLETAPDHAVRMTDLAERVLLTRSGITRLVDGLVRDGLVRREACESDRRVSYAILTAVGVEKLALARRTHHEGIRRVFTGHFSDDELDLLASLLGRLGSECDGGLPNCT